MSRVLYLDLVGGAAGDMLLAALLDAGADEAAVRGAIDVLGLSEVELRTQEVHPAGLRARQVDVMIRGVLADTEVAPDGMDHLVDPAHHDHDHDHHHHHAHGHRPYTAVRDLLAQADLPTEVRSRAQDVFRRLAEAEGLAHGVPLDEVVFHEVGADDALVDIVGVCAAAHALRLDRVVVSPVPLGRGLTRGAHGPIPLPGPATLHLLTGCPTASVPLVGETVTPTGAALLASLADEFGAIPAFTLESVGVGAGHKQWPDRPNVVRALVGAAADGPAAAAAEDCVVEANLDDMSPELVADLQRALFEAGAFDVWSTPVQMKKGRLGVMVSALVRRTLVDAAAEVFFGHSTTLGVRVADVVRRRADRALETVTTPYGAIAVKRSPRPNGPDLVAPEHDACAAAAEAAGVPVRVVYEAALKAAWGASVEGA